MILFSDFASAADDASFVNSNSDINFDDTWHKQSDLQEDIAAWILKPAQKKAVCLAPISKKIPTGWQSFTQ